MFPAGALVRAFETFDAVGAGVADMYHSFEGYFERKSPALHFFSAIAFGFTANELFAWVRYGGGQELWDALSAQFNIKSLLVLQHRLPDGRLVHPRGYLAGGVQGVALSDGRARRRGAAAAGRHRGDPARRRDHAGARSGAIDASEWIGPWLDMAIGLHKAVGYYYYPGFHEPGSGFSLGINKGVWDSFDRGDRQLIEAVAACEYARSLAEFNANNALSLRKLREEGAVKIPKVRRLRC